MEFERCIDFLAQMIQLYGAEVMEEIEALENNKRANHDVVSPLALYSSFNILTRPIYYKIPQFTLNGFRANDRFLFN